MNEYEKIMVEALVQDELKKRLDPLTSHLQNIIDYLRKPTDLQRPWLINSSAHAGAAMIEELLISINVSPELNIGQFPECHKAEGG